MKSSVRRRLPSESTMRWSRYSSLARAKAASVAPASPPSHSTDRGTFSCDRQVDDTEEFVSSIFDLFPVSLTRHVLPPDFLIQFARDKWTREQASWRSVIQLNVVRSVNAIVDAMERSIASADSQTSFTSRHQVLLFRLSPLRRVEDDLKHMLGTRDSPDIRASREFFVCSWEWRAFLQGSSRDGHHHHPSQATREGGVNHGNATEVIAQCVDDIQELWEDEIVQRMVQRREIALEDSAGLCASFSSQAYHHFSYGSWLLASWMPPIGLHPVNITQRTMTYYVPGSARSVCKNTN